MAAKSKAGLVAVQRIVTRKGKTFQQTVWVKPKYAEKVDKTKQVEVPDWNFKSSKDFEKEVNRINKIADRSERKILKENLLEHVEVSLGINYGKVPDTEKNAFARNCLKAFSLTKKHLDNNTPKPKPKAPEQPSQPSQKDGTLKVTKQPNAGKSDYVMERPESKELARKIGEEIGNDNLVESLKGVGITWNEVPEAGPNRMRALRALASFIRRGGEVERTITQQDQPKLVIADKDKPLIEDKPQYEKDSIQYDYEKAPAHHKLIGLATGILPSDEKTAEYLEKLVKEGKMGLNYGEKQPYSIDGANSASLEDAGAIDVGLPKAVNDELTKYAQVLEKDNGYADNYIASSYDLSYLEANAFKGSKYEAQFGEFKTKYDEFVGKHGVHAYRRGVTSAESAIKIVEEFEKVDSNWLETSGDVFLKKLSNKIGEVASAGTDTEINKLWDELEVSDWFDNGSSSRQAVLGHLIDGGTIASNSEDFMRATVSSMGHEAKYMRNPEFLAKVKTGELSKKEVLEAISKTVNNKIQLNATKNPVKERVVKGWNDNGSEYLREAVLKGNFNKAEFKKEMTSLMADLAPLSTPESQHIGLNIKFLSKLKRTFEDNDLKLPKKLEPIDEADLHSNKTIEAILKVHVGAMRKGTEKAKAKFLQENAEVGVKKEKDKHLDVSNYSVSITKALQEGKSLKEIAGLNLPSAKDVKHAIKASLSSVSEGEAKAVDAKIQDSHSSVHHEFKQKVHGVYRIKRIASEEAYQNWKGNIETNEGKGEEGFYYHGTSFNTAQKVIGDSGGFKVFKDPKNVKVGSMLGYGIYLAKQSSKSVLYVGDGYMSGNRGVMLLCKASLGNMATSTKKGFEHNQPLMNKNNVDSVFMDKPYVLNPEWAVKNAEQAVPRLWIDVERIYK